MENASKIISFFLLGIIFLHKLSHTFAEGLNPEDIQKNSEGSLLSVHEVAEWVVHGIGLPQEVGDIFLTNTISGPDFPELIEDDGLLLETELGIADKTVRDRLLFFLNLRLRGDGKPASPPVAVHAEALGASSVRVQWHADETSQIPAHKFRVQRRIHAQGKVCGQAQGNDSNTWVTVMDGFGYIFTENGLDPSTHYQYRVQAWNVMGSSNYVYVHLKTPIHIIRIFWNFKLFQIFQCIWSLVKYVFSWLYWFVFNFSSLLQLFLSLVTIMGLYSRLNGLKKSGEADAHTSHSFLYPTAMLHFLTCQTQNMLMSFCQVPFPGKKSISPTSPSAFKEHRNSVEQNEFARLPLLDDDIYREIYNIKKQVSNLQTKMAAVQMDINTEIENIMHQLENVLTVALPQKPCNKGERNDRCKRMMCLKENFLGALNHATLKS